MNVVGESLALGGDGGGSAAGKSRHNRLSVAPSSAEVSELSRRAIRQCGHAAAMGGLRRSETLLSGAAEWRWWAIPSRTPPHCTPRDDWRWDSRGDAGLRSGTPASGPGDGRGHGDNGRGPAACHKRWRTVHRPDPPRSQGRPGARGTDSGRAEGQDVRDVGVGRRSSRGDDAGRRLRAGSRGGCRTSWVESEGYPNQQAGSCIETFIYLQRENN